MILAKQLERLIEGRNTIMNEGVQALLTCRHGDYHTPCRS